MVLLWLLKLFYDYITNSYLHVIPRAFSYCYILYSVFLFLQWSWLYLNVLLGCDHDFPLMFLEFLLVAQLAYYLYLLFHLFRWFCYEFVPDTSFNFNFYLVHVSFLGFECFIIIFYFVPKTSIGIYFNLFRISISGFKFLYRRLLVLLGPQTFGQLQGGFGPQR